MGKLKKAIKKSVKLLIPVFVLAALIGGGYYWHKKKNEPPTALTYSNPSELKSEIERLEGLKKGRGLSWQDTFRLGVAYLHARRTLDAVETLKEAESLYPRYYKIYESLGMAYYRLGDFENAKVEWQKALDAAPEKIKQLKEMVAVAERNRAYKERAGILEK